MPIQNETAARSFIKKTNQRIKRVKFLQKFCRKDSTFYKRYEYQITVSRNQREQAYMQLGRVSQKKLPIAQWGDWQPTRNTRELDKLFQRFKDANDDEKIRIACKIIRASDTWLFEHTTSAERGDVEKLQSGAIHYIRGTNPPTLDHVYDSIANFTGRE